ncbi:NAD(P)/FAD-dependent oxidoreductase [bacterium]|nr:NAD(P)/FAD-dependent oxidoreductase [bacterium]
MSGQNRYDVVVLGAGPAGSSAAEYASKGGVKVALVERKEKTGYPVRCGEAMGIKGINNIGFDVDPGWIMNRIKKACLISPNGTHITYTKMADSYVVNREIMDADLVKRAVNAGTDYFPNSPVLSVKQIEKQLYECRCPDKTFTAPCIIIADGVESRLARDLGWNTVCELEDIDCCAFCRIDCDIEQDTCYFIIGSQITPAGYLWIFPREKGQINIGLGLLGSHSSPGKAKTLLLDYINKHYPHASISNLHCGGDPAGQYLLPLVKNGAMVVGDAARQVASLTGGGINYALFAGKTAGTVAAEAFQNNTFNMSHLNKYESIWKKGYGKQQLRSYALKSILLKEVNDKFLNGIASSLVKKPSSKLSLLNIFFKVFLHKPGALLKTYLLFR